MGNAGATKLISLRKQKASPDILDGEVLVLLQHVLSGRAVRKQTKHLRHGRTRPGHHGLAPHHPRIDVDAGKQLLRCHRLLLPA